MYLYHFVYKNLKWFGVTLPHHWCMHRWSSYNPLPPICERFPPLSYHLVEGKPLHILGPIRTDIPCILALLPWYDHRHPPPPVNQARYALSLRLDIMTSALNWTFSSILLSSKVHCGQLNNACSSIKSGNGRSTCNTIFWSEQSACNQLSN